MLTATQAAYDGAAKIVAFATFEPTRQFAEKAAAEFNAACPVGADVIAKVAGGEYASTRTIAPAKAISTQFGYIAMVAVEGLEDPASVKCVRRQEPSC